MPMHGMGGLMGGQMGGGQMGGQMGGGQNFGGAHPNAKTRLCTHWAESGSCGTGDRCGFAHGDADLRQPGSYGRVFKDPAMQAQAQAQVPGMMMPGMAMGGSGMAQPTGIRVQNDALLKTKLCSTFMQTGTCNYQDKCRFAHEEADLHRPGEAAMSRTDPSQEQQYPAQEPFSGEVAADPLVGPAMPPSTAPPQQPLSAVAELETQPAMTPIVPPVGGVDDTPLEFGASNGVKRSAEDAEVLEDSKRAKIEEPAVEAPST